MFCPVVGAIGVSGAPDVTELLLRFTATKPVEAHIHCFRASLLDVAIYYAEGRAVVGLYRRG